LAADLFLGADAGGTGIKYVVTHRDGRVLARDEVPTSATDLAGSMARLTAAASRTIRELFSAGATSASVDLLAGVGLACAGIVDPRRGTLGRSPNLPGWENNDLAAALRTAFPELPTALVNDVNGALYGEFKAGAGRGCRNLVMVALGTGVGGGVIVDGELLVGAHYGAGEVGHMVLDVQGPICTCGGRGCLESWAGSTALRRRARELVATGTASEALTHLVKGDSEALTPRALARLAETGDEQANELFAAAGRRLGQAVAILVNVLDPDRVIIGGGVAQAGDLLLEPCRQTAPSMIMATDAAQVPIVQAELGPHAAAVGAACLAREQERAG